MKGSPKRRRRWKRRLLLLSLLCGMLYFAEQRYDVFRLRDIELVPGNVLPASAVWDAVSAKAQNFWPALLLERDFVRRVEGFYPVQVKVRMVGWGRCRVELKPLEIYLTVFWNTRIWYLSTNGRMWLANLPSNVKVRGLVPPPKPTFVWDTGLAIPIDPDRQAGDVYPSSLPIAKISGWYDAIQEMGWYDSVYSLTAKRIDGRPVVCLLMGTPEQRAGEVILKEDTSDWASIAVALREIYPDAKYKIPAGHSVNATFSDGKFTVKRMEAK